MEELSGIPPLRDDSIPSEFIEVKPEIVNLASDLALILSQKNHELFDAELYGKISKISFLQ